MYLMRRSIAFFSLLTIFFPDSARAGQDTGKVDPICEALLSPNPIENPIVAGVKNALAVKPRTGWVIRGISRAGSTGCLFLQNLELVARV
jgi:hypothetical protein